VRLSLVVGDSLASARLLLRLSHLADVLSLSRVLDNYGLSELVMLEESSVKHFLNLALDVLRLHHALLELCVLPLELIPLC
jgi:hypothetical protein